jgi:hypothetical protein
MSINKILNYYKTDNIFISPKENLNNSNILINNSMHSRTKVNNSQLKNNNNNVSLKSHDESLQHKINDVYDNLNQLKQTLQSIKTSRDNNNNNNYLNESMNRSDFLKSKRDNSNNISFISNNNKEHNYILGSPKSEYEGVLSSNPVSETHRINRNYYTEANPQKAKFLSTNISEQNNNFNLETTSRRESSKIIYITFPF